MDAYSSDGVRRLEDLGVTDVVVGFRYPYVREADTQSLDDKLGPLAPLRRRRHRQGRLTRPDQSRRGPAPRPPGTGRGSRTRHRHRSEHHPPQAGAAVRAHHQQVGALGHLDQRDRPGRPAGSCAAPRAGSRSSRPAPCRRGRRPRPGPPSRWRPRRPGSRAWRRTAAPTAAATTSARPRPSHSRSTPSYSAHRRAVAACSESSMPTTMRPRSGSPSRSGATVGPVRASPASLLSFASMGCLDRALITRAGLPDRVRSRPLEP